MNTFSKGLGDQKINDFLNLLKSDNHSSIQNRLNDDLWEDIVEKKNREIEKKQKKGNLFQKFFRIFLKSH